jgi:hypothetical protein
MGQENLLERFEAQIRRHAGVIRAAHPVHLLPDTSIAISDTFINLTSASSFSHPLSPLGKIMTMGGDTTYPNTQPNVISTAKAKLQGPWGGSLTWWTYYLIVGRLEAQSEGVHGVSSF